MSVYMSVHVHICVRKWVYVCACVWCACCKSALDVASQGAVHRVLMAGNSQIGQDLLVSHGMTMQSTNLLLVPELEACHRTWLFMWAVGIKLWSLCAHGDTVLIELSP